MNITKILIPIILLSLCACHKDKSNGSTDSVAGSGSEPGFTNPMFQNQPTQSTSSTPTVSGGKKEIGSYAGRTNPNRPTWRWDKPMSAFPSTFRVVFEGCYDVTVSNNGKRWESGATVIKQSDGYPGMAALAESTCNSTTAYVVY